MTRIFQRWAALLRVVLGSALLLSAGSLHAFTATFRNMLAWNVQVQITANFNGPTVWYRDIAPGQSATYSGNDAFPVAYGSHFNGTLQLAYVQDGRTWCISGGFPNDCTPPPSLATNFVATAYYGNDGVLTLPVRLALISGGVTNVLTNQWAKPGEGVQAALTRTNPFTWQYLATDPFNSTNDLVLASGQGGVVVVTNAALPDVTTITPTTLPLFANVPPAPSTYLPTVSTNVPRATDYSTTQTAIQTLDQNQQARAVENRTLIQNVYANTYQASVFQAQATAQGSAQVAAAVQAQGAAQAAAIASGASTVAGAVQALQASLGNGGAASGAGGGIPTNSPTLEIGAGTGWTNGYGGLASSFELPSGGDSSIMLTIPFGSLGIGGLTDQTVDFLGGSVGTAAGIIRAFALFVVSVAFAVLFFRLIRGLYA